MNGSFISVRQNRFERIKGSNFYIDKQLLHSIRRLWYYHWNVNFLGIETISKARAQWQVHSVPLKNKQLFKQSGPKRGNFLLLRLNNCSLLPVCGVYFRRIIIYINTFRYNSWQEQSSHKTMWPIIEQQNIYYKSHQKFKINWKPYNYWKRC